MIVSAASRMFSAISFGVFCRFAPSTSAIIRSMKLSPGFWVISHDDPVGEHPGAAGDRGPVAARLADDRRRLAGDRRLVDAGDAVDDVPVAGDDLPGLARRRGRPAAAAAPAPTRRGRSAPGRRAASRSGAARPCRSWPGAAPRPAPCRGLRRPPRPGWRTARSATATPRSARRTRWGRAIASTVVNTAPTSTMNITGLRHSVRGSSLPSASGQRRPQHLRVEQPAADPPRPAEGGLGRVRVRGGRRSVVVLISADLPPAARARAPGSR